MAEKSEQRSTETSESYDSSGGIFPNGYCVWDGNVLVATHCKTGYECGGAPSGDDGPRFEGELVRVACIISP